MKWFDNAVVYQIYPLGYCGVPRRNPFRPAPPDGEGKILRVIDHLPELKKMGFNTVLFNPVFESTAHGYDTVDFMTIDKRLGSKKDFKAVCDALHANGFRIVLDAVFNHVGRDFQYFKDVREHKFASQYKDWFHIREGNSNDNDGFYYEGWEGHYDLVKLNLFNPAVKEHIFKAVESWADDYDIDGLRLDVAYSLDQGFLKELRVHCKGMKEDFWLMGETLHGDYNTWMNPEMLDSVTNYECYKGLYSSFNDLNMYEIAYSLGNRQFGPGGLYQGKQLYCFADNHDVTRIASILKDLRHIEALHVLLFTMPGIPGIYYGSEYGLAGDKKEGDEVLRPEFVPGTLKETGLTKTIAKLTQAHATLKPLYSGDYQQLVLNNQYFAFSRSCDNDTVYILINAGSYTQGFRLGGSGHYKDVLSGEFFDISDNIDVPAFQARVLYDFSCNFEIKPDREAVPSESLEVKVSIQPEIAPIRDEPAQPQTEAEKPDDSIAEILQTIYRNIKVIAEKLNIPLE